MGRPRWVNAVEDADGQLSETGRRTRHMGLEETAGRWRLSICPSAR